MNEAQVHEGTRLEARNLWLAGLGAMAGMEEGRRGLFDRLVERGRPVGERQKRLVGEVTGRTGEAVRELGRLVQDTVEYEGRRLIRRCGLMTREDLNVFAARLAVLAQRIDEYAAQREIVSQEAAAATETNPTAEAAPKAPRPRQRKTAATAAKG